MSISTLKQKQKTMAFTPNLGMILGKFSMASNKWKKIQSHDVNEASFSKRNSKTSVEPHVFPCVHTFFDEG